MRGDVYRFHNTDAVGREQMKSRFAVVVGDHDVVSEQDRLIVCPTTSQRPPRHLADMHPQIKYSGTVSYVMCEQVRAADLSRFDLTLVGHVDDMDEVNIALAEVLGLDGPV